MGQGANLVYFDEACGQLNVAYQQPPSRGDPHRLGDRDPAVEPHVGLLIQRKDRTPSEHLRFPHLNTARTIVVPRLVTVGGSRSASPHERHTIYFRLLVNGHKLAPGRT